VGPFPDNEVNELIPHDVHSAQDVDDLLATIRTRGLDMVEGEPQLPWSILEQNHPVAYNPSFD
jgi:RNA polymerase primary sigma factor